MPRRLVAAVLSEPVWTPPGVDPSQWRLALADDVLDVLALMAEVEAAVVVRAGELTLRSAVGWPGLRWYEAASLDVVDVLAAITSAAGPAAPADDTDDPPFDQVALVAADAPDLPGLTLAKLLRPLTSRPAAVAPAEDGPGLLGLACRLPAPAWLPRGTLDTLDPNALRAAAPAPADVAVAAGWSRLRGPHSLTGLDPRLEGWEATRALLEEVAG
jgi:hypothetical protein